MPLVLPTLWHMGKAGTKPVIHKQRSTALPLHHSSMFDRQADPSLLQLQLHTLLYFTVFLYLSALKTFGSFGKTQLRQHIFKSC